MKTDKKLILIPDFMIALKAIKDNKELSVTDLHHETRITYAHLHTLKGLFVQKGWIQIFEEGVKHILSITDKGRSVVEGIEFLLERLEISNEDLKEFRARTKHGYSKRKPVEEKEEEPKVKKSYEGIKMVEEEQEEKSPIEESPGAQLTEEEEERMEKLERAEVREARELREEEEATEAEVYDLSDKTPEEQSEEVRKIIDEAVNEDVEEEPYIDEETMQEGTETEEPEEEDGGWTKEPDDENDVVDDDGYEDEKTY